MMIRDGTATTEYNSNQLTVFRLNDIINRCNMFKKMMSVEGLQWWLIEVQNLDAELTGLLTDAEDKDLETLRIRQLKPNPNNNMQFILLQRRRIQTYENGVRRYIQYKGLGVTAKIEDDPGKVMMR